VQLLPESYAPLVPVSPDPVFKYINELLPGANLAKQLLEAIRGKCSALEVGGFIEAATELEDDIKINVMMQTFLHLGSRSFTHIFSILTKYLPVMKVGFFSKFTIMIPLLTLHPQMCINSPVSQLNVLIAVSEFWVNNDQLQLVMAEKLLKLHIVDANVIVDWVFAQKQRLTHMYLWELLNTVIRYTKNYANDSVEERTSSVNCLLLNIVESCVKVVTEHEQTFEQKETDYWSDWVLGRLQVVLFNFIDDFRLINPKLRQVASEWDDSKHLVKQIQSYLAYIQCQL